MSLLYQRIRLGLETSRPLDVTQLYEQRSNLRARFGVGRALSFEVGVMVNGTLTTNISDLSSMTLVIKPLTAAGVIDGDEASLLEKTTSTLNSSLTEAEWLNDSGSTPYHAAFNFADADTAIDMTDATNNELSLGIVITGLTAQGRITLASGIITAVNDGAVITGGTPPVATRTMTDQEIMALLGSKVGFTGNPAGSMIELPSAAGKSLLIWSQDKSDGSVTFKAEEVT